MKTDLGVRKRLLLIAYGIRRDGRKELLAFRQAPRQRCWVHKLRNVAVKLSRNIQKESLKGAKLIYLAASRKEAIQRYWEGAACWRDVQPKAVACLEKDLDELLTFFAFPEKHRTMIRTTNAIERSFREIRRRIRPMSYFTNERSCERIIYALFHYNNKKWENTPIPNFTQYS